MHALLHSVTPTLHQATADLRVHQRLLDTHGEVWVSLLWATAPFSWVLVNTAFYLADYGSDHELPVAKLRLKLKKVGENTRPFSSVQFSRSVVSDPL